jgi:hypothetical protein
VRQLLEFNLVSDAADQMHAFHACSEKSDCRYWMNCSRHIEDLWSRQQAAAAPAAERKPS